MTEESGLQYMAGCDGWRFVARRAQIDYPARRGKPDSSVARTSLGMTPWQLAWNDTHVQHFTSRSNSCEINEDFSNFSHCLP